MKENVSKGLLQAFWIAAASAALAVLFNLVRPGGIPLAGDRGQDATTGQPAGSLQVIGPEEAFALFSKGQALFLDARDPGAFSAGHIPSAVNVTPEIADLHLDEIRAMLKAHGTVIAYCHDEACPKASSLVSRLEGLGLRPVRLMSAGWAGWIDRGYPYE
jgi:rhodanese-related sulfurtransferase